MTSDPFFTPPTLSDLMDNLRECDAAFKEARSSLNSADRARLSAKMRFDAAETGLKCAETAVVQYMRKHGADEAASA